MAQSAIRILIVAIVAVVLAGGCAKRESPTALYVLEELEAASAVKDPAERVERLTIFIGNHGDSPYRFIAYDRVLEALSTEMKADAQAARFLAAALVKETGSSERGELMLSKFGLLMKKNREAAIEFADTLFRTERSPRLFLYMGYDFMESKSDSGLAVKCFLRSVDLSTKPYAKSDALAMAASVLEGEGKRDEAKKYLSMAAGDPEADGLMAKLLWAEGKREEALDLYIQCAAHMPGAREHEKLDSLYTLVRPGATDLDRRIMALRIGDEGPMPEGAFVDLEGKAYDLSKLKGQKIVLYALSPT